MQRNRQQKARAKNGSSGRSATRTTNGEVHYVGRELFTTSLTTAASGIVTLPTILNSTQTVLGTMASTFGVYRFEALSVTLYPQIGSLTAGYLAMAYSNEVTDQNAGTINAGSIATMPYSLLQTVATTTPQRLTIPRKYLVGANTQKFWRCQPSILTPATTTVWENTQGEFYFKTVGYAATATVVMLLQYSITFGDPQSTTLLPMRIAGPSSERVLGPSSEKIKTCKCCAQSDCSAGCLH